MRARWSMLVAAWFALGLILPVYGADSAPAGEKSDSAKKSEAEKSELAKSEPGKTEPTGEKGPAKKSEEPVLPESPDELTPVKLASAGTYIHVRNGTRRSLDFTLYVECNKGGTGKFDRHIQVAPGDTAIWRLGAEHKVLMTQVKGTSYYRVGLVGKDAANGKEYRWGLVGGPGMYGKERQVADAKGASFQRHIHVQPIGE